MNMVCHRVQPRDVELIPSPARLLDGEIISWFQHDPLLESFKDMHGRVGIFGGTFDPIHNGHVLAALSAMEAQKLDAVVFIPTSLNPLKSHQPVASNAARLEMLKLELASRPGLFVSPIELNRSGASYTIDTLREVRRQMPATASLHMIVGADCLDTIHHWREIDSVLAIASVIVVARGGYQLSPTSLNAKLTQDQNDLLLHNFVDGGLDCSSTQIKESVANGGTSEFLSAKVEQYIKTNGIY
jgi:nicotinate-nucleotide adenylyltransferase